MVVFWVFVVLASYDSMVTGIRFLRPDYYLVNFLC